MLDVIVLSDIVLIVVMLSVVGLGVHMLEPYRWQMNS